LAKRYQQVESLSTVQKSGSRRWPWHRRTYICEQDKTDLSAPRSPWQRAYVERVIGSIRRECLDNVIAFDEGSLRRTLNSYFDYYHRSRTHLSLGKDSPEPRAIQPPEMVRRGGASGRWTASPLRRTGCLKKPDSTTLTHFSPWAIGICVRTVLPCGSVHRRISFA
jgi:integrase-like protein